MVEVAIDPASPIPLYHQIAETIRRRIESREISEGEVLEPLREAAVQFGVNLHTVRHAYAELAREGLVETSRARGTVVRGRPPRPAGRDGSELERFVGDILGQAEKRFGLSPSQLIRHLERRSAPRERRPPTVWIVECSEWQCRCHAEEIEHRWRVEASPWLVSSDDPLPDGDVLATYFHYNEIRTRWPDRVRQIHFIRIEPDPSLPGEVPDGGRRRTRLLLCEFDRPTLDAVAADLSVIFDPARYTIETRIVAHAADALGSPGRAPILLSPRAWGELTAEQRRHPRLIEVRYLFDREELRSVAGRLGWERLDRATGARTRRSP